jgi:hypothetical protein
MSIEHPFIGLVDDEGVPFSVGPKRLCVTIEMPSFKSFLDGALQSYVSTSNTYRMTNSAIQDLAFMPECDSIELFDTNDCKSLPCTSPTSTIDPDLIFKKRLDFGTLEIQFFRE